MKKLGKLKLNQIEKSEIVKKEMSMIKGGDCTCFCVCDGCSCGCLYEGPQEDPNDPYYGGSSSYDNAVANIAGGYGANTHENAYGDGMSEYN